MIDDLFKQKQREYQHEYYLRKKKLKSYDTQLKYYKSLADRDKYNKEYYQLNRERKREYYMEHSEERKAYASEYRKNNREKCREYCKKYDEAHKEQKREYDRQRYLRLKAEKGLI